MIALSAGNATFEPAGDLTYLSISSGDAEPVVVALIRHQLAHLAHASRKAVLEAFDAPQTDLASIEAMLRSKAAG